MYWCMFEQSGTFKNEFKKLGYDAVDLDILNDFGETDYIIDLYAEINKAYGGEKSIFDQVTKEDTILAFFPCIRFVGDIAMCFKGNNNSYAKWSIEDKLENDLNLHEELHELYQLITKMTLVAFRKGLRLMIENPYSTQHYLHRYWCLEPSLIDYDRRERGDFYEKPTQYWFINFEPQNNFIFEARVSHPIKKVELASKVDRSMISKDYANRFIREFILKGEQDENKRDLFRGLL